MNEHSPAKQGRKAKLFRNGRNQAIRIPVEFELPGTEAMITKDGDRLIVEPQPASKRTLLDVLGEMEPISEEDWPDITDDDLLPLDDIDLGPADDEKA